MKKKQCALDEELADKLKVTKAHNNNCCGKLQFVVVVAFMLVQIIKIQQQRIMDLKKELVSAIALTSFQSL